MTKARVEPQSAATAPPAITRRSLMAVSALAPLFVAGSAAGQGQSTGSRALVAYFSRSGNTRVIAAGIARTLDADIFEIVPAQPYPDDYEATVAQAERERQEAYEPPLAATVPGLNAYDTVFLGTPVWGTTAPPVIRSFLSRHDLSGKTLAPFITHGGYGIGSTLEVIDRASAPDRRLDPFVLECDQERRTLTAMNEWLGGLGVSP